MVLAVSEAGPLSVATSVLRVRTPPDSDPVNTFAVGVPVSVVVWSLISILLRVAGLLPVENWTAQSLGPTVEDEISDCPIVLTSTAARAGAASPARSSSANTAGRRRRKQVRREAPRPRGAAGEDSGGRRHPDGFNRGMEHPGGQEAERYNRLPAPGSRLPAPGSRLPAPGSRLPAPGSRLPAPGSRLPAPGS